jgi:uncharacterized protein YbaP (TraB family)
MMSFRLSRLGALTLFAGPMALASTAQAQRIAAGTAVAVVRAGEAQAFFAHALAPAPHGSSWRAASDSADRHMLWRVDGGRGTVYLLGSVHLLTPDAYPLAPVIQDAFAKSARVVFEASIDSLQMRGAELVTRGALPAGQTLQSVLDSATWARLDSLAPAYHLPLAQVQHFKPWVVSLILSQLALQDAGFSPQYGIDVQMNDSAKAAGKSVGGLESVDFQIGLFDSLSPTAQAALLAESLISPDSAREEMTAMKSAWLHGDAAALARETAAGFANDSAVYHAILLDRTARWLPQVEAMLQQPQTVLVVVGAGHLVGARGLVALLRAKGYTVTQL